MKKICLSGYKIEGEKMISKETSERIHYFDKLAQSKGYREETIELALMFCHTVDMIDKYGSRLKTRICSNKPSLRTLFPKRSTKRAVGSIPCLLFRPCSLIKRPLKTVSF